MSARSGLLAGGNWIVDKLKFVDRYPRQDALASILHESVGNGGSPFNILINLARLKVPFPLAGVGLVGADANGEWIRNLCATEGINTMQLRVTDRAPTSYTDVMTVKSTGRRTFFHQRGTNALLDVADFDFSQNNAKIFHLGYLLLLDQLDEPDPEFGTVAARVLQRARKAGYKTSLDVVSEDSHRFSTLVLPALRHVDYAIVNDFEAERTTSIKIRRAGKIDPKALRLASTKFLEAGVHEWVIIHYPEGASATSAGGQWLTHASLRLPKSKIVSTVGAGDAFAAGVLCGLHDDLPIEQALQYGSCVAAACLCGAGTSDAVRPLAECLELEKAYGLRSNGAAK